MICDRKPSSQVLLFNSRPFEQVRLDIRAVEWVVLVFFLYTSVLATALPIEHEMRLRTLSVSAAVLTSVIILTLAGTCFSRLKARTLRNFYVLALLPLAYKLMGWFAPEAHDYALERLWIRWDHVFLVDWGVQPLIQSLGASVPTLLELAYLLVYAVGPFCVLMLYVYKREHCVHDFLVTYVLGLLLSYAQFPFWPSEPPRTVFAGDLEPVASWVRTLNLSVVGNLGIHTSVFPSAHVSGAFAAAFASWSLFSDKNGLRLALLVYAILVAIATVYGRYHFAVDAVAGIFVAGIAFGLGRLLLANQQEPLHQRPQL